MLLIAPGIRCRYFQARLSWRMHARKRCIRWCMQYRSGRSTGISGVQDLNASHKTRQGKLSLMRLPDMAVLARLDDLPPRLSVTLLTLGYDVQGIEADLYEQVRSVQRFLIAPETWRALWKREDLPPREGPLTRTD